MILMAHIFDVTSNENARYKRNELEYTKMIRSYMYENGFDHVLDIGCSLVFR